MKFSPFHLFLEEVADRSHYHLHHHVNTVDDLDNITNSEASTPIPKMKMSWSQRKTSMPTSTQLSNKAWKMLMPSTSLEMRLPVPSGSVSRDSGK